MAAVVGRFFKLFDGTRNLDICIFQLLFKNITLCQKKSEIFKWKYWWFEHYFQDNDNKFSNMKFKAILEYVILNIPTSIKFF